MSFNGSDKALGWHNYGYLYNYVLPLMHRHGEALCEIGIGTNNLDVVSSMGKTGVPGASLRGWREFLGAPVTGGDVDRRILFEEPGITTCFVDQLAPDTVADLVAAVHRTATIFIDDGLHTFEANLNVMEAVLANPGNIRLFVVEDVMSRFIPSWISEFSRRDLKSAILSLPHIIDDRDNTLVFVILDDTTMSM